MKNVTCFLKFFFLILVLQGVAFTAPAVSSEHALLKTPLARNEIVFIDSSVDDYWKIVDGIKNLNIEIIWLENGIEDVFRVMAERKGLDAIHFISHGEPGVIKLGNDLIDRKTIEHYAGQFFTWRRSLKRGADILIYGCNTAEGDVGSILLSRISVLTGANVAGSENRTGSRMLGGDWVLEKQIGKIETAAITAPAYGATLDLPDARSYADDSGNVYLGGDFIEFGVGANGSSGVISSLSTPTGFYGRQNETAGGFLGDADGFDNGADLRIDYFLPGTPAEGWGVSVDSSSAVNSHTTTGITYAFENQSTGDTLRTIGTGTHNGLQIDHEISFEKTYNLDFACVTMRFIN